MHSKLFSSLLTKYQVGLEASMKGCDFTFDSIDGMYYNCHGIVVDLINILLTEKSYKKQQ